MQSLDGRRQRKRIASADSTHVPIVYVIAPQDGWPCKIGHTTNLEVRLTSLQAGCWEPLTVHGFRIGIKTSGGTSRSSLARAMVAGAQSLEMAAHSVLRECDTWMRGEWFDVTAEDALRVLDKCGDRCDVRAVTFNALASVEVNAGLDPLAAIAREKITSSLEVVVNYIAFRQPNPLST